MGLWSYPIPEGGKRMIVIELSIRMAKTAPATTCTFHTDWEKCCIFQEYHYGCYTMIATNMQYFSSMPSWSFVLDHVQSLTKAEEAQRRNKVLAPGRCTK